DVTMTAPACPAADQVVADCHARAREVAGVKEVDVKVVWDPPWTPDRMSEAAKLELGMGF
ncbi:MAG: FeS assembly SUF system protein, partial [Planctomycetota bacterium]